MSAVTYRKINGLGNQQIHQTKQSDYFQEVSHGRIPANNIPKAGPSVRKQRILADTVYCLLEFLDSFFEAVDSSEGYQEGDTFDDDTETNEEAEALSGNIEIAKAEESENRTKHTEDEDAPPEFEIYLLVVKCLDSDDNTFYKYPDGKNDRKRDCEQQFVAQENAAYDNLEDCRKDAGSAVGDEALGIEHCNEFCDTGNEGNETEKPCHGEKGGTGTGNAENAEEDEENAGYGNQDFC